MKFNWGIGLIITFALFASGMIYLLTLCTNQNEDLVSLDYYNQEIKYQWRINAQHNASQLSGPVTVNYDHESRQVRVIFPAEFEAKEVSGSVHFFKPDDASLDFNNVISTRDATQVFTARTMKKGLWKAQVQWKSNDMPFYNEQNLMIN
jgi:hypothetical protein